MYKLSLGNEVLGEDVRYLNLKSDCSLGPVNQAGWRRRECRGQLHDITEITDRTVTIFLCDIFSTAGFSSRVLMRPNKLGLGNT
jgi:hypothetical protein